MWSRVSPSNNGKAALQKKAIAAIATSQPAKPLTKKKLAQPATAPQLASRMIVSRRARPWSANQPHAFGASTRINCICESRTASSQAENPSDCRYCPKKGEAMPTKAK